MTAQEVFNTVAHHLLTQKKKSFVEMNDCVRCMYRGPDGLKCAVGILIPDDMYDPKLEHKSVVELIEDFGFDFLGAIVDVRSGSTFLLDLQELHDFREVDEWKDGLRTIAFRYSLCDDVLKEF